MAGEKFTVSLVAKTKKFIASMGKATRAMKLMGDMSRGLTKNMQKMSSAAKKGGARFGQSVQKLKTGVDKANRGAKKGTKTWSRFFKVFALGAGAIGLVTAAFFGLRKAFSMAADAAAIQVQAKAFANLAASYGESSAELVKGLREASKGTVDNLQLMTTASRAMLLGIPITQLVELMEVARGASKAMGTTVSGAFSDIALGIGRQSRLILDNLGIIVRVGTAYATYAEKIGTTADALTDFEKKQAFATAALKAGHDNVDRSATGLIDFQDRIAKLQTTMTNFGNKFKGLFLAMFIALDDFMQESGLSTSLKEFFEITMPELLLNRLEFLIGLLERLDLIVKSINKEGIKATVKQGAKNFMRDYIDGAKIFGKQLLGGLFGKTQPSRTEVSKEQFTATATQAGETFIKKEEKQISRLDKMLENYRRIIAEQEGGGIPTLSPIEHIADNIEKLNEALKDTEMSAQDLEQTFSIKMAAIAKHIENIRAEGALDPAKAAQFDRLIQQAEELEAIYLQDVKPESFLAGLGILSDKEFEKTTKQAIAKFNRMIKGGKLTDPVAIRKAYDTIFKEVLANVDRLTPQLREKFMAINKWMAENAVPNDSIREGLNQWVDDYRNTTDRLIQIGKDTANAIATAFENFFFDSVTGQLKSLEQTMIGFGKSILRSVSKGLGQKATEEILRLTGIAPGKNTRAANAPLIKALNNLTSAVQGKANALSSQAPSGSVVASLQATGTIPTTSFNQAKALVGQQAKQQAQTVTQQVNSQMKTTLNTFGTKMKNLFSSLGNMLSGLLGAFSMPGQGKIGLALQQYASTSSSLLGTAAGFVGSILPFAKGGITSLAKGVGDSAMVTKRPTLAAISERGQREAIVPLDKFSEMLKPISVNINAVDTKSFAQYMHDNKEVVLGSLMSIKGSTAISNMNAFNKGPF